jgi:AcrR family transcriptional regulator
VLDKVALRRQAKVDSIVKAAWRLAREHGVTGLSLHGLAREVGMRQPSLYEYFDGKMADVQKGFSERYLKEVQ